MSYHWTQHTLLPPKAALTGKGLTEALQSEGGDVGFDVANLLKKSIEMIPGSLLCDFYKSLMRICEIRREV